LHATIVSVRVLSSVLKGSVCVLVVRFRDVKDLKIELLILTLQRWSDCNCFDFPCFYLVIILIPFSKAH